MEKLLENVKKELKEISEQGLSLSNLDTVDKLVDIYKDIEEIQKMGGRGMYRENGGYQNSYWNGDYNNYGRRYDDGNGGGYGRRGSSGRMYRGNDPRMRERVDRFMDGVEQYEYGRERYMHGDSEERIYDGLEKLMYGLCMFVESTMEFAESPQEKEIIRKHIQKLSHL